MERMRLAELHAANRKEAITFLKALWNGTGAPCPCCGQPLEPLHKKAKHSDCDWQCRACQKTVKTLYLLDEINEQMPD